MTNNKNTKIMQPDYKFLTEIDQSKIQLILDTGLLEFQISKNKQLVIVSTFYESPRYNAVVNSAKLNPDTQFIYLADVNNYDHVYPDNVTFFKYRHWHLPLMHVLNNIDLSQIPNVKSKKIYKKFSSLSYYRRQFRAIVTLSLLKYAANDSIISWHNLTNHSCHDELIKSLKSDVSFDDLDWEVLNYKHTIDNYTIDKNYYKSNILDFLNPQYQNCLINFSNETDNFGLYWIDDIRYNRPGPFLTEKTWKPLISGNVLMSIGQPGTYDFLKNDYNIPINYSIDTSFDNVLGDFDRIKQIKNLIESLSKIKLSDLIDQNIDNCELIQNTILTPGYIDQFELFNQSQDIKILEKIEQIHSNT